MDGLMSRIGLSGKAFVPFVIGFGCSVPAVMATRTLESKRDRIITILSAPLVTCSARMEVLVFVAGAFFGASAGNFVWAVVALSLALSVGTAKLFGLVLFKNQPPTPLLIELPPYRVPTVRASDPGTGQNTSSKKLEELFSLGRWFSGLHQTFPGASGLRTP